MMKAQICMITPSLAKQMLETNKNNRRVSKGRVKMYAEDMRNGNWKLNGQAISFYEDKTLADGQHRLLAIIESNTTIQSLVITGLERDVMPTIDSGKCSNQSIAAYRDWLLMNRTKEGKYGAAVEMNALAQCWNDYVSGNVRKRVLSGKVMKEKIAMK